MIAQPLLSSTTVCYPLSVSPRFTLERALQGFSHVGLRFAEIVAIPGYCEHLKPAEMGDQEIENVKQLLKKYDLTPNVINVAANLTTETGVEFLGQAMRVARALGVDRIVTNLDQTETETGAARFMKLVPNIISIARQYNTVIAFETHGGLITTGAGGVKLLKEIGSEWFKLTYDMANVVYCAGILPEEDLAQLGHDIGRFIAHVHLKDKSNMKLRDYNFPAFGTGILDFRAVLNLLFEGGYRGAMTLEVELDGKPETPELVDEALAHSFEYLQRFWRFGQ